MKTGRIGMVFMVNDIEGFHYSGQENKSSFRINMHQGSDCFLYFCPDVRRTAANILESNMSALSLEKITVDYVLRDPCKPKK